MASETPSTALMVSELPPGVDEGQIKRIFEPYGSIKACNAQGPGRVRIVFATQDEATWIRENLDGNIPEGLSKPVSVAYTSVGGPMPGFKGAGKAPAQAAPMGATPYGKGAAAAPSWGAPAWGGAKGDGGMAKGDAKGGNGDSIQVLKQGLRAAAALPGGKWANDANALYICNLPADTCDVDIYEIFSPFGAIPSGGVRAMQSQDGQCTGIGFVNFLDPAAASASIATLNGTVLPSGQALRVTIKRGGKAGGDAAKGKGKAAAE